MLGAMLSIGCRSWFWVLGTNARCWCWCWVQVLGAGNWFGVLDVGAGCRAWVQTAVREVEDWLSQRLFLASARWGRGRPLLLSLCELSRAPMGPAQLCPLPPLQKRCQAALPSFPPGLVPGPMSGSMSGGR